MCDGVEGFTDGDIPFYEDPTDMLYEKLHYTLQASYPPPLSLLPPRRPRRGAASATLRTRVRTPVHTCMCRRARQSGPSSARVRRWPYATHSDPHSPSPASACPRVPHCPRPPRNAPPVRPPQASSFRDDRFLRREVGSALAGIWDEVDRLAETDAW